MTAIDDNQVKRLAEDLQFIKSAINKNSSIIRRISFPRSMRLVSLLTGLLTIVFCLAFHVLIRRYGSHAAIPASIKIALYSLIAVCTAATGQLKMFTLSRAARRVDPAMTYFSVFREIWGARLFHFQLPISFLMLFLSIYCIVAGIPRLIVPIAAIGVGILFNCYGSILMVPLFMLGGYWFMATGLLSVLLIRVSPLINCSYSIGAGMLIFAIGGYLAREEKDPD